MMTILSSAKWRALAIAALATSAVVVAGCGSASSSSSSTAAAAPAAAPSSASSTAAGATSSTGKSSAASIGTAKGSAGTYLTGADGRALYLWVADSGGKSACSGTCAKYWPPLETRGKPTAGSGVDAALLGMSTRTDGSEQVTYKGHPLYYFLPDKSKGQTRGQGNDGFGAKWWLVAPSGAAITGGGPSGSASSSY